jgi:hypothetical protein
MISEGIHYCEVISAVVSSPPTSWLPPCTTAAATTGMSHIPLTAAQETRHMARTLTNILIGSVALACVGTTLVTVPVIWAVASVDGKDLRIVQWESRV